MNRGMLAAAYLMAGVLFGNPAGAQEAKPLLFKLPGFGASFVSFAADGKSLACGYFPPPQNPQAPRRFTAISWDLASGKQTQRFEFPQANSLTIRGALSPDGKTLALDAVGSAGLFDVATSKKMRELDESGGAVKVEAFSPDGRMIVGSSNGELRVWSAATGKQAHAFGKAHGFPRTIAISGDGRTVLAQHLATAGASNGKITLCLWEVATGKKLWTMPQTAKAIPVSFGTWGDFSSRSGGRDHGFRVRLSPQGIPFFTPPAGKLPVLAKITPNGSSLFDFSGKKIRDLKEAGKSFVADVVFSVSGRVALLGCNWSSPSEQEPSSETLVYDLSAWIAQERATTAKLTASELGALWNDLASADDAKAHRALFILRLLPRRELVPFLREQARTIKAPDPRDIARWIDELDSSAFKARDNAAARLKGLGADAAWALREARKRSLPLEQKRRIDTLLTEIAAQGIPAQTPRGLRVLDLLEEDASSEALEAVEMLSRGTPGAWLTVEAQATSRRRSRER